MARTPQRVGESRLSHQVTATIGARVPVFHTDLLQPAAILAEHNLIEGLPRPVLCFLKEFVNPFGK
jgi:hypothetical protein